MGLVHPFGGQLDFFQHIPILNDSEGQQHDLSRDPHDLSREPVI